MLNDKSIFCLINRIFKKRKNTHSNVKNSNKIAFILYKNIQTTNIDKLLSKIKLNIVNLYPEQVIINKLEYLKRLSVYISKKINSNIIKYRVRNSVSWVELMAVYLYKDLLKNDKENIIQYINYKINSFNLHKKEIAILPHLIIKNTLYFIYNILKKLKNYSFDIEYGAKFNKKMVVYSNAQIYGIAKYNPNLLNSEVFINTNIKKCVFLFISKLDDYNSKLNRCISIINTLVKFTSFKP